MKTLLTTLLLASSLSAFSGTCEEKITASAEKMIGKTEEITEVQSIGKNEFVVTYYMYDTCYGSIFVEIAPTKENDCEVIKAEEPYYPRCH